MHSPVQLTGQITVTPPLNERERDYLRAFADTRHMRRGWGPYYVDGARGYGNEIDVTDRDFPPEGQPSLWCDWEPTSDGTALRWNGHGGRAAMPWMRYLIDHFLGPGAIAQQRLARGELSYTPAGFASFTWNHTLNGVVHVHDEDRGEWWRLTVANNTVSRAEGGALQAPSAQPIILQAIRYGRTTIEVAPDEWEQAKAKGFIDQFLDWELSDVELYTVLVEPDGTRINPYGSGLPVLDGQLTRFLDRSGAVWLMVLDPVEGPLMVRETDAADPEKRVPWALAAEHGLIRI